MIASNFAILDIFKLLLDMGASINDYDNNNFSPLLYASKSKRYAIVLYLLIKEAKYDNMEDSNGCSMVHWAAYNNDTWLLRFYDKLKP